VNTALQIGIVKADRPALIAELNAAGVERWNGTACCCPFCEDKHPSAGIYGNGTARFKCHSCGFEGDIFDVRSKRTGRPVADILREESRDAKPSKPKQSAPAPQTIDALSAALGVSVDAIKAQGTHRGENCWRTPERDAQGNIVGHAMRLDSPIFLSGKWTSKISERGGKRGLTTAWPLSEFAGAISDDPILICEGASDQAAGHDLGFVAIGRPSATGGLEYLREVCKAKHVCVVGENDQAGRDGAEKIAAGLHGTAASVRVVFPPEAVKDLRAWKAAGLAGDDLREIIDMASTWTPSATTTPTTTPATDCDDVPTESPILDPRNPMPGSRSFVRDEYHDGEQQLLVHHHDEFRAWRDSHYAVVDDNAIRAKLWSYCERAKRRADQREGDQADEVKLLPFQPTSAKVGNMLDALKAVGNLPNSVSAPAWLTPHELVPSEIVAHKAGLLHLPTMETMMPTPSFYTHNALPFAFDKSAPMPTMFLKFLTDVLVDQGSIDTMQEMFGYLLTPDTRHQKIFLIVGPKRSGKGTIARIIRALLGDENVCGPTLSGMSNQFGLAGLIGKLLAIISDARLSSRADQVAIAERLLSISGEDAISIPRKHLGDFTGKLPTRFLVLTNELPRLTDASGALASRFVIIQTKRSFYGEEDTGLTGKLMAELPGILNWAIEGHHRLAATGHFNQPEASKHLVQDMADLGSPVAAFVRDECVIGDGRSIERQELYRAWKTWCESEGRDHPGTAAMFGRELSAAFANIRSANRRVEDGRLRFYENIDLRHGFDTPPD